MTVDTLAKNQADHELLLNRCDRCVAPVQAVAWLNNGELRLCGHHMNQHGNQLRRQGALITWEI